MKKVPLGRTPNRVPNVVLGLMRIAKLDDQTVRKLVGTARDAGISQADFIVLGRLSEAPDRRLRTGELAELLAWEKSRVSHQLKRMVQRGLVTREECGDDARGVVRAPPRS